MTGILKMSLAVTHGSHPDSMHLICKYYALRSHSFKNVKTIENANAYTCAGTRVSTEYRGWSMLPASGPEDGIITPPESTSNEFI